MEKWRRIFWIGAILGIVVTSVDAWIISIPYIIIIPVEIVSLVLIFAGLVMRKNKKKAEKQDTSGY